MTDFFDGMAAMARDILTPSDQGGLGAKAGSVVLVSLTPVAPANPWDEPPPPTRTELPIRAQAFGVGRSLIGTPVAGTIVVAGDMYVIAERVEADVVDSIELDGVPVTILSRQRIPEVGVVSAVKFIVRR